MARRIGGFAVLALLLLPLGLSVAQLLHARSLVWGDQLWPGYAKVRLACNAERAAAEAAAAPPAAAPGEGENAGPTGGGDDALIDDLLGGEGEAKKGGDDALIDDLLGEGDDGAKAGGAAAKDPLDELLGDDEPGEAADPATEASGTGAADGPEEASAGAAAAGQEQGEGGDDDLLGGDDDLLEGLDAPAAAPTPAAAAAAASALAPDIALTDSQRRFCAIEHTLGEVNQRGVAWMPLIMVALLLLAAIIATVGRHHIALRTPRSALEDRVSTAMQLLANGMVGISAFYNLDITSGTNHELQQLWVGGTSILVLINVVQFALPVRRSEGTKTGIGRAIAAIPLYAWMAVISGLYFFGVEHHPAGIAIYLQKISAFSILYIQVGLYLWTGMLLRDTSLGQLFFDLVRPLRMPPELFAVFVVICAAVPTAYSGASGILVLALGATIFTELRRSGLSQQRALAATAMSGSLGVVLPPCLLVVIVASLNLDVTTDELFHWGWRVFGLSVGAFALVSWLTRSAPWKIAPAPDAGSQIGAAARRLLPYVVIAVGVVLAYDFGLDAGLDEHTAPYVLPVAMMLLVPWDRFRNRRAAKTGDGPVDLSGATRATLFDTGTHIGALLMLMGLSACLGGVIERSEIIELFPHDLGSPYSAMAVLMFVLVLIGMVMDPYGAVILVSVTLYPIAKDNGIHPLNFWMVALVSFELGYLTPPVALNHLLTRQVVETTEAFDEDEDDAPTGTFFQRYERYIVPAAVMLTTLLVVAFGPLLWGARA